MQIIDSFGLTTEDAARIRQDIHDIAKSSETLDAAIRTMREKYDAESMVAGFMFYAAAFTSPSYGTPFMAPNMN